MMFLPDQWLQIMLDVDSWLSERKNGDEHYVEVDNIAARPTQTKGRQFSGGQNILKFYSLQISSCVHLGC